MNNEIFKRGTNYYFQKTFDGRQRQVPLGTDHALTAQRRKERFILTAEHCGFSLAMKELRGRDVVKRGQALTFDAISALYEEFCEASEKPPRANTRKAYLNSLERIMKATRARTVDRIKPAAVREALRPKNPTPAQRRSFASIVRNAKSVFKRRAMLFYAGRGFEFTNPLAEMEVAAPKVEAYSPLPDDVRLAVWGDCRTELGPQECMIVRLGMGAGLRRSEIEACRVHWFSVQPDKVLLSIQEEEGFKVEGKGPDGFETKSGHKRVIPIARALYDELLELRALGVLKCSNVAETQEIIEKDPHFIPVLRRKGEGQRLWGRFETVNKWLKSKGVPNTKKLHDLRKELGCQIAKETGSIFEAARVLGNSPLVAETHYVNVVKTATVNMDAMLKGKEDETAILRKQNEELLKTVQALVAKIS